MRSSAPQQLWATATAALAACATAPHSGNVAGDRNVPVPARGLLNGLRRSLDLVPVPQLRHGPIGAIDGCPTIVVDQRSADCRDDPTTRAGRSSAISPRKDDQLAATRSSRTAPAAMREPMIWVKPSNAVDLMGRPGSPPTSGRRALPTRPNASGCIRRRPRH